MSDLPRAVAETTPDTEVPYPKKKKPGRRGKDKDPSKRPQRFVAYLLPKIVRTPLSLKFTFPIMAINPLNTSHGSWQTQARHRKAQREVVLNLIKSEEKIHFEPPYELIFTRVAPRALDREDNLNATFKTIRDQLCEWLGVDDGPKAPVHFSYLQRPAEERTYGVEVEIVPYVDPMAVLDFEINRLINEVPKTGQCNAMYIRQRLEFIRGLVKK